MPPPAGEEGNVAQEALLVAKTTQKAASAVLQWLVGQIEPLRQTPGLLGTLQGTMTMENAQLKGVITHFGEDMQKLQVKISGAMGAIEKRFVGSKKGRREWKENCKAWSVGLR